MGAGAACERARDVALVDGTAEACLDISVVVTSQHLEAYHERVTGEL